MNWTSAQDIKEQLTRLWNRGELLRATTSETSLFPLRLRLKAPHSHDLTQQFQAVFTWISALSAIKSLRIDWKSVNHRVQGSQQVPQAIWLDTLEAALAFLGKRAEAAHFSKIVELTRDKQPALLPWVYKRPLQALELSAQWSQLLDVIDWFVKHPRPPIYLRQVDVAGVHTKFIEKHRAVLMELLDLVLPEEMINTARSGVNHFAARYGFKEKPLRIRFRVLDPHITLLPGAQEPDLTLDTENFARLNLSLQHVFITENEINFLAFPPIKNTIVIFGAGYGWDALSRADWLNRCKLHYWGDIDTHGFAILDQLRSHFSEVSSFLMDHTTLMTHQIHWVKEDSQINYDLQRLTPSEQALYDDLRDNRIRTQLRLEQERIGFDWVIAAVKCRVNNGAPN